VNEPQAVPGTCLSPFKVDGKCVGSVELTSFWSTREAKFSSTTERMLFNFDPDFLEGGNDCLCLTVEGGGDVDRGGEEEAGGFETGNDTSVHCGAASVVGKYSALLGDQAFLPIVLSSSFAVSGGEAFIGLGEGEGALALIESGCKMLKI